MQRSKKIHGKEWPLKYCGDIASSFSLYNWTMLVVRDRLSTSRDGAWSQGVKGDKNKSHKLLLRWCYLVRFDLSFGRANASKMVLWAGWWLIVRWAMEVVLFVTATVVLMWFISTFHTMLSTWISCQGIYNARLWHDQTWSRRSRNNPRGVTALRLQPFDISPHSAVDYLHAVYLVQLPVAALFSDSRGFHWE